MRANVRPKQFHRALIREVFPQEPSDETALCLMLILHACRIELSKAGSRIYRHQAFEGLTSRDAGSTVAALFEAGSRKASYVYWYWRWNGDWDAMRLLDDLPERLLPELTRVRCLIESHPWVARVANEDWELFPD